jgi:hypothetical protein
MRRSEAMLRGRLQAQERATRSALRQRDEARHRARNYGRPPGEGFLLPFEVLPYIEHTLKANQDGHGDRWRARSVAHHVGKAMGHGRRALGPTPIDEDSGMPHLVLAATRMVLAVAVMLEEPTC